MKIRWKKEGAVSFIPVLYLFVILVLLIIWLMANKAKVIQVYDWLEDTIVVSSQAVCVPDRYIPGAFHWNRKDVVFDTGSRENSEYYITDPVTATKYAAELSYQRIVDLLDYNLPENATRYQITNYVLVNVISGTAYSYDYLHRQNWSNSTNSKESYVEIGIEVQLELPAFGTTNWVKETRMVLVEE